MQHPRVRYIRLPLHETAHTWRLIRNNHAVILESVCWAGGAAMHKALAQHLFVGHSSHAVHA